MNESIGIKILHLKLDLIAILNGSLYPLDIDLTMAVLRPLREKVPNIAANANRYL